MTPQAIVLNGGSSSGKSSIVRALQALLPEPRLAFGIDDFVAALPAEMLSAAWTCSGSASAAIATLPHTANSNVATAPRVWPRSKLTPSTKASATT